MQSYSCGTLYRKKIPSRETRAFLISMNTETFFSMLILVLVSELFNIVCIKQMLKKKKIRIEIVLNLHSL